jgi:hypothetical protein
MRAGRLFNGRIDKMFCQQYSRPLSVEWAVSTVWTRIVGPGVQSDDVLRRSTRQQCDHQRY